MSKGQIYEELKKFLEVFKIRSNWIMTWREKLGKINILKIRLQEKYMESKITQCGLVFVEKLNREMRREKSIAKRDKMIKLRKFKLIYEYKLKCNVIGKR